ncbi:hypothetical protein L226DRAFT_227095 [Lentinus tigrinus ALCF2SS1-7]|uniref:uncharacterized protein n=1 Tax=Lentinus tigrinus ALCF2SS1-7 TaxID=1328758 RepID=UPI0011660F96|nr:hypothetical protein L226DRAFT_227095 [Lentinus tigrinus ALCF2SS1-7]
MSQSYVSQLNHFVQVKGVAHHLSWREKPVGPRHAPEWHVTWTYMSNDVGDEGTGSTKAEAKEAAAPSALNALQQMLGMLGT